MAADIGAQAPSEVPGDGPALVRRWLSEIDAARKAQREYRDRVEKIVKRFRDEKRVSGTRYNILWANTETLCGAVYQQPPKPDVRRRFADQDPVGRDASQLLERALAYHADALDFDGHMRAIVFDYVLSGRGWGRVKYRPTWEQRQDRVPVEPDVVPEGEIAPEADGTLWTMGEPYDVVAYEEAPIEYIPWDGWISDPEPLWERKRWVAIRHRLNRDGLRDLAPEVADQVMLDWAPEGVPEDQQKSEIWARACVWEVWDREARQVLFIATGYPRAPLRQDDDPLRLQEFFPGPAPVTWSATNDSDDPICSYMQYQDQANLLDLIEERIAKLTRELKRRGVVFGDENSTVVEDLAKAGDNVFVKILDPAAFIQNGGIDKVFMELPIESLARTILNLREMREDTKRVIYEVTGISDVMRGQTKATETLGAQQLKANYGSMRLHPKIADVERFARDLMRIQAEIIAEMFSGPTLAAMTNMQPTPEVLGMLQNDKLRGFRVSVETRSTLASDDQQERQDRIEFLGSVTSFMRQIIPQVQAGLIPAEVAKAMLMFGVRGFRVGRELEDALDLIGAQPAMPTMMSGAPGVPPALPSPQMPSAPAGPAQLTLIPGGAGPRP